MEHQKHLEAIKQITVDQIQSFRVIADLMHERDDTNANHLRSV